MLGNVILHGVSPAVEGDGCAGALVRVNASVPAMALASFTGIYGTTLLTVSTLLALATAVVTTRDRTAERAAKFVERGEDILQEVASAVVQLVEAADRPNEIGIAKLRLRAAVGKATGVSPIPLIRTQSLLSLDAAAVKAQAESAIAEVDDASKALLEDAAESLRLAARLGYLGRRLRSLFLGQRR